MVLIVNKNKSFFFPNVETQNSIVRLPLKFHFNELKERIQHTLIVYACFFIIVFLKKTLIIELLISPVGQIKFLQLSPNEYFLETIKIAFYISLTILVPFLISQLIFYITPALTNVEKKLVLPIILISLVLFFFSIFFSYFGLIPAALKFFINYNEEIIEPLWSFSQYIDFTLILYITTGVVFQIPILQILLGILRIISGKKMLKFLKFIILITFIISAILTPSTDPITQILLSLAIIGLYLLGAGFLIGFGY